MKFLKKYNLTPIKVLKIIGLLLVVLFIISIGLASLNVARNSIGLGVPLKESGVFSVTTDSASIIEADYAFEESLTQRSVSPPRAPQSTGNDAEDFEVTEYRAVIETRDLETTCNTITDLKPRDYVIFENANEHDRGCSYTFKVTLDRALEILAIIETLNPKDLSENTYTIKRILDNLESESDILENKLETITNTLQDAIIAYDRITILATQTRDAESLAKIIDSKIKILDRLTREKINVLAQIERLNRSKAEQLDRLEYTYFYVHITQNKFIDGERIADSWKASIRRAVTNINQSIENVTVNLIVFIIKILQYALYLLIIIFVARYGWTIVKRIWRQ